MALDNTERTILRELQHSGRMSNVELAEKVGLSESPCFRRVKNLESTGVIAGYAAAVDQRKVGLDVTAYVLVNMEKQPDSATQDFQAAVLAEPFIIECHAVSGSHDYLMKVVARNIDHFSELIMQQILKYPGVVHVESNFSLQPIKETRVLPVG